MIRNTANQKISAMLISRADGSEVNTGTTLVYITMDGATQFLGTGTVEFEGHGNWTYYPTQAETNGAYLSFVFTNPLAITVVRDVYTTAPGAAETAPPDTGITAVTAEALITYALNEIGFVAPGETPSSANLTYGLVKLNSMLDSWSTQRRFIYYIDHNEYTFPSSKQSYTIGPTSADFTVASRPDSIEYCNLILVGTENVRTPLPVIHVEKYADISIPALSSDSPTKLYYQPDWPNGVLWPWPYPTDLTNKLELFTRHKLSYFTSLNQMVSFPTGYRGAIIYSLAEQLCPAFGRPLTTELVNFARDARANIANVNIKSPTQETDYPASDGGGMRWNPQIRGWS